MIEKTVKNWEEFEEALSDLESSAGRKQEDPPLKFLYRGQADSKWKLETTLDRFLPREFTLNDYYRKAYLAKPKTEVFLGKTWNIPTPPKYGEWLKKQDELYFWDFKGYGYFAYLRHHGFPSPLLDWTASPYVAAFFAMNKVGEYVDYVSIYAYCESTGVKLTSSDAPIIHSRGPFVAAHKRHFMQQSQYTFCTARRDGDGEKYYAPHDDVFSKNDPNQDLLWKCNIPTTERIRFLEKLQTMNINSYSLFGTEDSLMDSIATSVFLLDGDD